MTEEIRAEELEGRGSWAYSNLGAATAGQAVAAATGMSCSELMRTRLFEPLGMNDTVIQDRGPLVPGGKSQTGLPVQPWVIDAYAPAGATLSTTKDLARLATALLDGNAPGMTELDPVTGTAQTETDIGAFWVISRPPEGQEITWHSGETGGYSSYFGLDRTHRKAVIVLSNVRTGGFVNEASTRPSQAPTDPDGRRLDRPGFASRGRGHGRLCLAMSSAHWGTATGCLAFALDAV